MSSDDKSDGIIGLIGAIVFAALAIVVPFLKLEGFGFITDSALGITMDFMWDGLQMAAGGVTATTAYTDLVDSWDLMGTPSNIEIVWTIIPLWGFVFIGLGLIGALLVLIPAIQKMTGSDPMGIAFYGFLAGFIATFVEVLLFVIVGLMEENLDGGIENFGWITIGLIVVGWVALFFGYKKASA